LEHFKGEERVKMVKEQVRVLKPGGYLIICIPNCTIGALRLVKVKILDMFRMIKHFTVNINFLNDLLNDLGITIISKKFLGCSLHIRRFTIPTPKIFLNNRILADDILIIGKKGT
jgi:hypothetical protein